MNKIKKVITFALILIYFLNFIVPISLGAGNYYLKKNKVNVYKLYVMYSKTGMDYTRNEFQKLVEIQEKLEDYEDRLKEENNQPTLEEIEEYWNTNLEFLNNTKVEFLNGFKSKVLNNFEKNHDLTPKEQAEWNEIVNLQKEYKDNVDNVSVSTLLKLIERQLDLSNETKTLNTDHIMEGFEAKEIDIETTSHLRELIGKFLKVLQNITGLVMVIIMAVTGFDYVVLATSDIKSEIKKKMLPVMIGLILVFGAVSISEFVIGGMSDDIVHEANEEEESSKNKESNKKNESKLRTLKELEEEYKSILKDVQFSKEEYDSFSPDIKKEIDNIRIKLMEINEISGVNEEKDTELKKLRERTDKLMQKITKK